LLGFSTNRRLARCLLLIVRDMETKTTPRSASRRLHVRRNVSWTAWVTAGKTRVRCHTVDLSANGARLKPRGEFQPGTPVALQFQPADGPMMEVSAVVWRVEPDSMAVMFLQNVAVQVASAARLPEHGRRGWR
jgi:hypothetical protein